ncbi:MAG: hypothetical protein E7616_02045 [Ruminococcaceae bacterium]|nr:hypothetical protein [Oscillospiraceae bacterium]
MKIRILSFILLTLTLVPLLLSCGGEMPEKTPEPATPEATPTPQTKEPVKEPPREVAGNIVFYCDVPEYEKIKDAEMLENAVLHMQQNPRKKAASVSVWLCEDAENKSNTKEYYATLYENASEVLSALMYTDIHPNEYAPFVSMTIPYSALLPQTILEVAENELIAMVIVSYPLEIVGA